MTALSSVNSQTLEDRAGRAGQRVHATLVAKVGCRVLGRRIRSLSVAEGALLRAGTQQHRRETVVALVAARLVIDAIGLLVLPHQVLLRRPRPRPGGGILHRDRVLDGAGVGPGESLHEVQLVTRSLIAELGREVRDVHHQRVPLPTATRVAETKPDRRRKMLAAIHRNHPLPSLTLTGVVEDRHHSLALDDAPVTAEVGQYGAHAALGHAAILGVVVPIGAPGVVEGRDLVPSRRDRPVLAAGAGAVAVLARFGGLQQGQPVLALGGLPLGGFRRQRRNTSIRRIDHHRRPLTGRPDGLEHGVVGTGHIAFAAALDALVAAQDAGALLVERLALLVGERFLVGELLGPLQRRLIRVGPDALQVWFAPSGVGRRACWRGGRGWCLIRRLPLHR
uniref:Uncharacterized protein n=1 Tax=uncultured Acidobacteriota bacterium TaxID=171953 RepID=Q7X2Y0_9BACT|nr:hypothetical protein [uncultured Acidobacteriota bacterium]